MLRQGKTAQTASRNEFWDIVELIKIAHSILYKYSISREWYIEARYMESLIRIK